MRVWLVRHGPTHQKAFTGWRDVPADLSDKDHIARVAAYLPNDAHVISSDLQRAIATADAIAPSQTRLPHDPALREFDFGIWDGQHFSQVAESHPVLSRAFWEQPGDISAPEGESWNDVAARVNAAIDHHAQAVPDQDLIVVAHIGVIMTQIQRATDGVAYHALAHTIDNLSITDMTHDGARWHIGAINHNP
ncbi:histidine phosphatase family protein [Yoonia sp. 208BN28-4]|uniref:histidine phosphatase family protein n=1 Tax=Yoonia sp. 208BN28-4 TaxID=3126505 RepID=UPI0030989BBE